MYGLVPAQLPAPPELLMLLLIIIILFGADKIPELARSSGKALGEFRKGKQKSEEELKDATTPESEDSESDASVVDEADEDKDAE